MIVRSLQTSSTAGEALTADVLTRGYGQLAAYFSRHFAFMTEADPSTVIIAPEGLSRFYLSGNGGRVGARFKAHKGRADVVEGQRQHCRVPVFADGASATRSARSTTGCATSSGTRPWAMRRRAAGMR